MMAWKFSDRSLAKMQGVHPALQGLMKAALPDSPYDFGITEGLRSPETQRLYVENGKSRTMSSKHLSGMAVDIVVYVDGHITWDFEYYREVAAHIKKTATRLNMDIVWGGDWKSFLDGPHFELRT